MRARPIQQDKQLGVRLPAYLMKAWEKEFSRWGEKKRSITQALLMILEDSVLLTRLKSRVRYEDPNSVLEREYNNVESGDEKKEAPQFTQADLEAMADRRET
jgi:hypothetical protein